MTNFCLLTLASRHTTESSLTLTLRGERAAGPDLPGAVGQHTLVQPSVLFTDLRQGQRGLLPVEATAVASSLSDLPPVVVPRGHAVIAPRDLTLQLDVTVADDNVHVLQ